MILYPPDDPFLFSLTLFGLPITVRWYGVLIMGGAMLAAMLVSRRAQGRGIDPDHVWNQLMLGLIMGIAGARIYYVAFEWNRFAADPLSVFNLTTGGIAIHGAIAGALLSGLVYTRYAKLNFLSWTDLCMPGFLLAQGVGRWGNFFNQEAYGRPTDLGFGLRIDPEHRLPPYNNMQEYPITTLFHPTFLYESIWNIGGAGLLLWLDRRFGTGASPEKRWLRTGDILFLYMIIYSLGRVWIEGLRLDSLCADGVGGQCDASFRVAQWVSVSLIVLGAGLLVWNHRRKLPPETPETAEATEAAAS